MLLNTIIIVVSMKDFYKQLHNSLSIDQCKILIQSILNFCMKENDWIQNLQVKCNFHKIFQTNQIIQIIFDFLILFYLVYFFLQDYDNHNERLISIEIPYRAQVKLTKKYLYKFNAKLIDYVEFVTKDAFQDKQSDIMIISLIRSEGLGFLTDYRREKILLLQGLNLDNSQLEIPMVY
ncbi:unnamed protein product [Paramecium primaurelia]|uniref:DNA2/NAM7 helicase-like C-terminal domain-containing protein n=1 Tax=Paramecium primaurelia TaxID=5886 RepID=A0A8S1M612_PARPR|nr:unnamed protein product [Paramecium primaurelia]